MQEKPICWGTRETGEERASSETEILHALDAVLDLCENGRDDVRRRMAMLPILQREVVDNKHWATEEELVDYFAIGQCTPGIIAVNTATFIGQKYAGIAGGIVATLGVVFPSLVIISILAGLITNFSDLAWVQNAFAGIQVCVCVLIFNAVSKLLKKSVVDKRTAVIFVLVLLGGVFLDLSPVWFVIGAALAGIVLKNWEVRKA